MAIELDHHLEAAHPERYISDMNDAKRPCKEVLLCKSSKPVGEIMILKLDVTGAVMLHGLAATIKMVAKERLVLSIEDGPVLLSLWILGHASVIVDTIFRK